MIQNKVDRSEKTESDTPNHQLDAALERKPVAKGVVDCEYGAGCQKQQKIGPKLSAGSSRQQILPRVSLVDKVAGAVRDQESAQQDPQQVKGCQGIQEWADLAAIHGQDYSGQ